MPSIVGGGVVTLAVAAGVAVFAPDLRRLDLGRRLVEGPGAAAGVGTVAPPGPSVDLPDPTLEDEVTEIAGAEVERLTT